jgi:hypothetical protein
MIFDFLQKWITSAHMHQISVQEPCLFPEKWPDAPISINKKFLIGLMAAVLSAGEGQLWQGFRYRMDDFY